LASNALKNNTASNLYLYYQLESKQLKLKIPYEYFDNTMRIKIVNLMGNVLIDNLIYNIDSNIAVNSLLPGMYVANIYGKKINNSIKFVVR
jgi:hypothetical protein